MAQSKLGSDLKPGLNLNSNTELSFASPSKSSQKLISIGRIIGPGEEQGQVKIQTKDNLLSRIGEYLVYKVSLSGEDKDVFITIVSRKIIRNIPASFLADPETDGMEIAEALGLDNALDGIEYELTANTLGYFDPQLEAFVNPRINPNPNTKVFLASDELIKPALFSKQAGEVGSATIGHLLLRPNLSTILNVREMVSTHLAILAGTGSGKSYLARVLVEELMRPYNRAAILILDPHGEYQSLSDLSSRAEFQAPAATNSSQPYKASVQVLIPGDNFQVSIFELSFGDIRFLLPDLSEKMSTYLESIHDRAYKKARAARRKWTYRDLLIELEDMLEESEIEANSSKSTLEALKWRLEKRFNPKGDRPKIFIDDAGTPLEKLFRPGQCTVLKLEGVEEEEQQVMAAILLKKVYAARERTVRGDTEPGADNALEYPVFVLVEEAHRFAPAGDSGSISAKILRTVLAEGRKFGVGVGLITQRPGKLDQNVLSQCMTQFLMRIINPTDQDSIAKGVESAGRELLKELPSLSKGQAIVAGVAVRTPILFKVRKSYSEHKGASANAPEEWVQYFDTNRTVSRKVSQAVLGNESTDDDWLN
ncbi:MAG: ATP-binding protein [Candidatus Melainabacteria bacterium]